MEAVRYSAGLTRCRLNASSADLAHFAARGLSQELRSLRRMALSSGNERPDSTRGYAAAWSFPEGASEEGDTDCQRNQQAGDRPHHAAEIK